MTTFNCFIIPDIDLTLVPEGTSIKILDNKSNPNQVEINVSHRDELTLCRLVYQIWGLQKDEDVYPVDIL